MNLGSRSGKPNSNAKAFKSRERVDDVVLTGNFPTLQSQGLIIHCNATCASFAIMPFDDSNKAFIQAFLARNVLTLDEAKPMLASIWSVHEGKEISADDVSQDNLNSMISASNKALTPLDYEIRTTVHQDSRETYYALVNTTSDQLTQMATTLSNDEIAYVKRLLDEIFDKNNTKKREALCIHGKDALNLVRAGRRETQSTQTDNADLTRYNLTMNEGEATLAKLVAEGWLEKSGKGFYSLSPRGLMELKSWLVETYDDDEEDVKKIKDCEACKQIVTSVSSSVLYW